MASIVWATAATRMREANLLRLLQDPEHKGRIVEVRLFKEFSSEWASQTRRWITDGDLAKPAKELSVSSSPTAPQSTLEFLYLTKPEEKRLF